MGIREGHRCGVGVVDAFAEAGYPIHRSASALHQASHPRRGGPAPRTDTWRSQPELTASQPTARNPYPRRITIVRRQLRETARQPGFPHPSGPPGGAVQPASQSSPSGCSRQHGSGCPPRLRQGCQVTAAAAWLQYAPGCRQRQQAGRSTLQPNPLWPGCLPRSRCPGCVPLISPTYQQQPRNDILGGLRPSPTPHPAFPVALPGPGRSASCAGALYCAVQPYLGDVRPAPAPLRRSPWRCLAQGVVRRR